MRISCYRLLVSTLPSTTLTPMLSSAVNLSKVRAPMHAPDRLDFNPSESILTNMGAMNGNDGSERILIALVPASKELAQTSYFMATNSLHLTTMCLRYPPTIVACVCIHLACKWSKYEIPISGEVLNCFSCISLLLLDHPQHVGHFTGEGLVHVR